MTDSPRARHAEQVTATVLFADLVGFSRFSDESGTELAYLAATSLLRQLDEIARRHGASVDKYLGDKLMAVFGTPIPLAHPVRAAALAAIEMRQAVRDHDYSIDFDSHLSAGGIIPFGIHIGINTGELVNGDVRGPVIREFHVLGDAVNVAARINAKAPDGEIWVGPRTHEEIRAEFQWNAIEPLRLKGKSNPVPAFELKGGSAHEASAQAQTNLVTDSASATDDTLSDDQARALVRDELGDAADDETIELVLTHGGRERAALLRAVFLAPALRSQREQQADLGQRSTDAERRRAAIVFADISGFTAMTETVGAERAYPVVAACLEILDEVTRAHGGTVDHFLGDCAMALFGIPRAIEDAPRAALNAAIEMRRRIRAFNETHDLAVPIDLHTGVATGLGIAGDISGPMIREFAVMGDHVDRADVLTDAAEKGSIRVDAATHHATRDVFRFAESESMLLPGSNLPQTTWDLLSTTPKLHRARASASRQVFSELVGRDEQLGKLRDGLIALSNGSGGVISITAEAGIGKSRLLTELRSLEEANAASWMEGRALSNGRNLRYHPFADLLRSWAQVDDDDDDLSARAKVDAAITALLPESADEVAPFVSSILGLPLRPDERERMDKIQGESMEKMVRRSLTDLLRAESQRMPLVVVMDDLHWADQSSIELLESMLRITTEHPLLFLNVARPGFTSTSDRIRSAASESLPGITREIVLEPLDTATSNRLLANLFAPGALPHKTRGLIEQKARGNPFYIEEVVRSLLDEEAVEFRDGLLYATDRIHDVNIPGSVQEVVMTRVDSLELRLRTAMQVASVIGGNFHEDVLAHVVGEVDLLRSDISRLIDLEFLAPSDRARGVEYAFKHPLIQEVTYEGILRGRREELHRDVARAIEANLPEDVPGYNGMLAFHYGRGRDVAKTEEFLFRAGDEAARVAASSEALEFFQQATKLYLSLHGEGGDPLKKATLTRHVATALYHRGQFTEAVEAFNDALELFGESVPRHQVALILRFAKNLVKLLGGLYLPIKRRNPKSADATDLDVVELMFHRGQAQLTGSPTRFVFDSADVIAKVAQFDASTVPRAPGVYAGAVGIFAYGGISFDVSRRFLEQARSALVPDEFAQTSMYGCMNFAHHFLSGDWSPEQEMSQEFIQEALRYGCLWEVVTYLGLEGTKHMHKGDRERARKTIELVDVIWDRFQYDLAKTVHYFLRTIRDLGDRKLEPAIVAADAYYEENPEDLLHIQALSSKAKAQILSGDLSAAEETLALDREMVERCKPTPPLQLSDYQGALLRFELAKLEAAIKDGDSRARRSHGASARRLARKLAGSARRVAWRRVEALRLGGRAYWLSGSTAKALRWWKRSLDEGERLGAKPELARTYAELGHRLANSHHQLDGKSAEDWNRMAAMRFSELELDWDMALLAERTSGQSAA